MAKPAPAAGRVSPASIALIAAALLAVLAIGIAIFRSGGEASAIQPAAAGANANATSAQADNPETMIAGLREQLRTDPDNHQGWYLLGLTYRSAGRFEDAVAAFRRAMELAPNNADYVAYLGEALLLAAGDTPPPEAERLFRRALELQAGNPQARYYLATLKDMRGDHRGAVDDLVALLRTAPPGASWEPQVREAATNIARQHNIDLAGRLPAAPPPSAASSATAAIPGPTPQQMQSATAIPPSQQDAMVQSMVARLEARLRTNPRDAEGWIRLMRSKMVLQDPAAARRALNSGVAAFQGDAATQGRLREAATALGVPAA
ncbi:MAG TPA: tetratricopeptide repeat protein [Allosphingosinicella sp.]